MTPTATPVPRFDPGHVAESIRRLELVVSRKIDGLLQGQYQGFLAGHGSELGETRQYYDGDDVRRIDWNVTARMQAPYIREIIADHELETWVVVDLSASLSFGTALAEKRDLALAALSALGFLTLRTGNRFGAVLFDGNEITTVPAKAGRKHLHATLRRAAALEPAQSVGDVGLRAAVAKLSAPNHRQGVAVVISDFLDPGGWPEALRHVAVRHDVLAVEVVDPRELELPNVGLITVVDPESGRQRDIPTGSAKVRARYAEAASAQRAAIEDSLRSAGADHLQLRTDRDWLLDFVRFVALRKERVVARSRR